MARSPRKWVIDETEVGVFHCTNRCVRRAFLGGTDVVLRNRPDMVRDWSDSDVARRWWRLFPSPRNEDASPAGPQADDELRILDESALAACLAYVDLNPIRAQMAETPETSRFTSAYERIQGEKGVRRHRIEPVGTMLCFAVGADDAKVFAEQLSDIEGRVTPADLMNLPKYTAYIRLMIDGTTYPPFSMETLKPPAFRRSADRTSIIRRLSQERYGRAAATVAKEIAKSLACG